MHAITRIVFLCALITGTGCKTYPRRYNVELIQDHCDKDYCNVGKSSQGEPK